MRNTTGSTPLKKSLSEPIKALLIGAMLITPIATAHAADDTPTNRDSEKLKRQILLSLDDPAFTPNSLSDSAQGPSDTEFRSSETAAIQYKRTLQIGDDEVSIKLDGSVVKKNPGLRFQVEGLRFGDHPVHVESFGNIKGGGLRVTVRF